MAEYVVGPGETYTTIAAALAVVDSLSQPLTEVQQIEVKEGVTLAPIVIPVGIQPSLAGPLHIVNYEFHRPKVGAVTMDKEHLKVSGLEIDGDVAGGEDGQLFSENLVRGKAVFTGDGINPRTVKVCNNVVITLDEDGVVIKDMPGGSRAVYNTILCRTDLLTPVHGLVIEESDVDARFNILTAMGSSAARCARLKNTGGWVVNLDRNLYWLYGAALIGTYEDGMGVQDVAGFTAWQAATGMELASLFDDPEFKCLDEDEGFDLDVSNSSPAIAEGEVDPDAVIDFEKTRRPTSAGGPLQSTTLGAYEEAQIITVQGKTRILELISGLSTAYIGLVAVGDEGTISTIDYLKPETPSMVSVDLDHRIFLQKITRRFVIDITGYFECVLAPSPRLTEELLDDKIDVMTEVGLLALDGLLFLRRTLYRIPFDPLSVLTMKITFGVSIGPCTELSLDLGPELEMSLELVPI